MKKSTFKHIEDILRDYPKYDKYLMERELEILYPYNESKDDNVGGRNGDISKTVEVKALRLADDRRLCKLKEQKQAVDEALEQSDSLTISVIAAYYFDNKSLTWDGVSQSVSGGIVSNTTCRRMRDHFVNKVANNLGW